MSLNFPRLIDVLQKYTQNNNPQFIEMIPLFVANAQQRIVQDLKILPMIEAHAPVLNGTLITKSPNWLSTISLRIRRGQEKYRLLQERTVEYIEQYSKQPSTEFIPLYYADLTMDQICVSSFLPLDPADQNDKFKITLRYYSQIATLSLANPSNAISQNLPNLLLYSSLMETAPYLHDDERLQAWSTLYQQAKASVTQEDIGRIQQQKPNTH